MTDLPSPPPPTNDPAAVADGFEPPERGRLGALRVGVALVLAGVVAGLVMGAVWSRVTPKVWLVVRADGAYPEPSAQGRWFAADGWFLFLGLAVGAVLAVCAWWWGRRFPVAALLGLTVGGLLAAVVAWVTGGVLGPNDPTSLVASATPGTQFAQALGLRAMAVLLAPAIAGVAVFVTAAAVAPPHESDERLAP